MAGCWDNWGFIGNRVTEWQSHRVTDTQGYSVYGWVKFFVPDFNKLPFSLRSQGDHKPFSAIPCNDIIAGQFYWTFELYVRLVKNLNLKFQILLGLDILLLFVDMIFLSVHRLPFKIRTHSTIWIPNALFNRAPTVLEYKKCDRF